MALAPEAVLRTWFDELWNQHREGTIDRLFAAEGLAHGLPGGPLRGPAGFRSAYQAFLGAFPDIEITVERSVTDGDHSVMYCRVTGTHTGDGLGIPPTGRRVEFTGMTMAKVSDGQIREGWNCFDFLSMYQQLGALPAIPGG